MKALGILLVFIVWSTIAVHAEPIPCDSCAGYPAGSFMTSGGPELGGDVWFLSCQSGVWEDMNADSGSDPCAACSIPIGTVCADGAVYAGDTPTVGRRMYVANFDEGGTYQWKTTNTSTAGTISVDGLLNTDAMEAAGLANHPAGQACRSRGANWYLPSHFELAVIYANRAQLGSANIPNSSNWYWSSSQTTSTNATAYRFDNNSTSSHSKNNGYRVRCVRR